MNTNEIFPGEFMFVPNFFVFFLNFLLLQKAKQYYDFGEDEEFQCYTGFDLEGFQFINCLPDGTWSQPKGRCLSMKEK